MMDMKYLLLMVVALTLQTSALAKPKGQLIMLTDMTATRDLQEKVNRKQRLSTIGKMVASISHQIRTPIAAAMLYTSNIIQQDLDTRRTRDFSKKDPF